MKNLKILIILIVSVTLSSCEMLFSCIEGNGDSVTQSRGVSDFTGIYNNSELNIEVLPGLLSTVEVEADENLQQYINTYVQDNSLVVEIEDDRCLDPITPINITITCPELSRVVAGGSGRIYVQDFSSGYFTTTISGSGDIILDNLIITNDIEVTNGGSGDLVIDGKATNAFYDLSGSGKIDADRFRVENASVTLSGSGSLWVNYISQLTGVLSGSGDIHYIGPDEGVNIRNTGSGNLIKE